VARALRGERRRSGSLRALPDGSLRQGTSRQGRNREILCGSHRPGGIRFQIRQTGGGGNACVAVGTITTKSPDGKVAWCEVVNLYEVDEAGKITLLRSYWDFDAMVKSVF
jgi:hypothetical protein